MNKVGTMVRFQHLGYGWHGRVVSDTPVVDKNGEEILGTRLYGVSEFCAGLGNGFVVYALNDKCTPVQGICPWCAKPLEVGDEDDSERFCEECAKLSTEELRKVNLDRVLRLRAENPGWFEEGA